MLIGCFEYLNFIFLIIFKTMASFGEGDAGKDLVWAIGLFLVLGIAWVFMGGPASFKSGGSPSKFFSITNIIPKSSTSSSTNSTNKSTSGITTTKAKPTPTPKPTPIVNPNESQYKGLVEIRLGQSYRTSGITNKEYVTLQYSSRNKEPINISGWKIDNGYSARYTDFSGKMVLGKSTVVSIPYGTVLMTGKTPSATGSIILNPGDTAYVVTGSVVEYSPYKIDASFKINKCSGYLEKYDGYNFVPTLSGSCPAYDKELDKTALSDDCYDFVRRYGKSCVTPKITNDDKNGGILVGGQKMSSSCRKIIESTFNYNSCLDRHLLDEDFLGKKWYVFLRHQGGLYASERATITLYDSLGKMVDTYS